MTKTKSAMEQMVEWLEYYIENVLKPTHLKEVCSEVLKVARRLLAEEQAQKPTAPASLVEELEVVCRIMHGAHGKMRVERAREMIQTAISRYRPAPSSADEGLRGAIEVWINKGVPKSNCIPRTAEILEMGYDTALGEIRSILMRHLSTKSDRCGEIIKGLVEIGECVCHADRYIGPHPCAFCKAKEYLAEFSKDADGKEGR